MRISPKAPLLAALAALLAGCHEALEPTRQERIESFRLVQGTYAGDSLGSILSTFLVVGTARDAAPPWLDPSSGAFSVPAVPPGSVSQGLATAVDRAGYLVTAAHLLRERTYVVGWMGGRLQLREARVVRSGIGAGRDLALLAVPVPTDASTALGAPPRRGDPVFAVVCNRAQGSIGGELCMAAGRVLDAAPGSVSSTVPLWYGDSGGPLLSADGALVGVNTSIRFAWVEAGELVAGYARLSVAPDAAELSSAIGDDKARRKAAAALIFRGSAVAFPSPSSNESHARTRPPDL